MNASQTNAERSLADRTGRERLTFVCYCIAFEEFTAEVKADLRSTALIAFSGVLYPRRSSHVVGQSVLVNVSISYMTCSAPWLLWKLNEPSGL